MLEQIKSYFTISKSDSTIIKILKYLLLTVLYGILFVVVFKIAIIALQILFSIIVLVIKYIPL